MEKSKAVSALTIIVVIALLSIIVKVYDIVPYKNLTHLLPVIGVISLISGTVLFVLKKGKRTMVFSILFLLVLLISNFISVSIINNQRQRVFADGVCIAEALNNYYRDNNNYPKDLIELVPKYIDSIPKIKTTYSEGDFSYYVKDEGKSYYLGFEQYYFDGNGWIEEE